MTGAATLPPRSRLRFELPPERSATAPAEARGLDRDQVRLLVARPGAVTHTRFARLADHLRPGDLVVVNTSATVPAALDGYGADGRDAVLHLAGPHPAEDGTWVAELRAPDASGPRLDAVPGSRFHLAGGAELTLRSPHPDPHAVSSRLWRVSVTTPGGSVPGHLARHGRPLVYGYVPDRWPLASYQTVLGRNPGSAEMMSAARPFTTELVTELVTRGVAVAPVVLHTGVSSLDAGEPPEPERFEVAAPTAALVEHTRRRGGRIVAVGTTVTRALETVASPNGTVTAGRGWTDLVLSVDRPARVVDGLVTGWHASDASHLALLESVAGPALVERAYEAALAHHYLWHEFGDSCLLLP